MFPSTRKSQRSFFPPFVFTIQWHLTAKCPQNCMHCYMGRKDEEYQKEIREELDTESCLTVIDDFVNTFGKWGVPIRINFTGGDPLLRSDVYKIIGYAQSKNISIGILGNPNYLEHHIAVKLKSLGVDTYQLSIDGCEQTHDMLRKRDGLYRDTFRAVNVLNDVGIRSVIMYTVHKINAGDLIKVIHTAAEESVTVFDFSRLVPIGNAKELKEYMLDPYEYRDLLLMIFDEYRNLNERGCKTRFGRKDSLWNLLFEELGLLRYVRNPQNKIIGGCGIGWQHITILANGKVVACRRLPVEVGHVPFQSIKDIFLHSKELNEIRNIEQLEKCRNCSLFNICRGCPAIAYGETGNYFAPDPQCWKIV